MDKAAVIAMLREHEPELRASGIVRLSLFGSVARGERGNDVDLMAEFDTSKQFSLLDEERPFAMFHHSCSGFNSRRELTRSLEWRGKARVRRSASYSALPACHSEQQRGISP